MRGTDQQQGYVFSYISPEQRVRQDHPLRPIRTMVDKVLKELSPEFNKMYSKVGRPSIPPEQLLRATYNRAVQSSVQCPFNVEVLQARLRKMTDSGPRRLGDAVATHSFVVLLVYCLPARWRLLESRTQFVPEPTLFLCLQHTK
jgi:hypothetical protein